MCTCTCNNFLSHAKRRLTMVDFDGAKCCAKFFNCWSKTAHGLFRQLALLCVVLSFLGWVIFAAGFGAQVRNLDFSSSNALRNLFVPYWCSLVAGPVAFVMAVLHIVLGYRFRRIGYILGSFATLAYLLYAAIISSPLIYTALFIFGASSFGDFEDAITGAIPIPDVTAIIGIDNDLFDAITSLVSLVYELAEDGIEFVVDLLLNIPSSVDGQFDAQVRAQFSGCVISLFFLGLSMVFWPLYSEKKSQPSGSDEKDLR